MFGFSRRFSKPGTAPGTLSRLAAPTVERSVITVCHYGPAHLTEKTIATAERGRAGTGQRLGRCRAQADRTISDSSWRANPWPSSREIPFSPLP